MKLDFPQQIDILVKVIKPLTFLFMTKTNKISAIIV